VRKTDLPIMQFYFYRIDRKVMDAKWSRALASLLWKEKIRVLVYFILKSSDLLLKVFVRRLWNDSLNAQAYNHINATIISIGTDWRDRGYDYENFGTRITWFGITVEKV
jgi:hypothetical protein